MARTIKRNAVPTNFHPMVVDYAQNRALRERAETEEAKLKKALMSILEEVGTPIEGGHRVIDLDTPVPLGKKVMVGIKRQRRAGQSLAQDRAEEYLRRKGMWEQCTTTVTVIDEEAVLAAAYLGQISDVDMKGLYDEKETFAFYPVYEGE